MRRLVRIIRNVLLVLIAAVVAVAAVLAFNVFSQGSRQLQVAAVPKGCAPRRTSELSGISGSGNSVYSHFT